MGKKRKDNLILLPNAEGIELPQDILAEDSEEAIQGIMTYPQPEDAEWKNEAGESLEKKPYIPSDPSRPWRDFRVQQGARQYLYGVVLPVWVSRHNQTHKNCGNPHVDEWGRWLCNAIQATGPVDGPWENPIHFLFYAYNRPGQLYQWLNYYLLVSCDILV